MWWSRAILALAVCLPLASCGFKPVYGSHSASGLATAARESGVEIANIPNREGQRLRNLLIDRLYLDGRPAAAPFILVVAPLKSDLTNLGIRKDATSTRGMLQVSTTMTLVARDTNQVVLERDVRAVGGYNQLDNRFATLVAQDNLTDHMLEELSDSIVTEVSLYLSRAGQEYQGGAP